MHEPLGVVLAGGRGRQLGGEKTLVSLRDKALAVWVYEALSSALEDVVVACKPETTLPVMRGLTQAWVEPEHPRSPLAGLRWALEGAGGRSILVCSLSFPLISPDLVRRLATAACDGCAAVVPETPFGLQPLVARYEPHALDLLPSDPMAALVPAVAALNPRRIRVDSDALYEILTPEDLLRADAVLDRARPVKAKATV